MRRWISILSLTVLLAAAAPFALAQEQFLLMVQIQDAINSGDFSGFKYISEDKISVNFESPFKMNGYLYIEQFIEDFNHRFSLFKTKESYWSSLIIEEKFAIQSINLILKNQRSEKTVYYKFIFFLAKKDQKWKIYYLRGLKI